MNDDQTSVSKTIGILLKLAAPPYESSALELSGALGLNRSTIHRNLNALMAEILVTRNPVTKKYRLGPAAYHIGSAYLRTIDYLAQIRAILERIAKEMGQAIGFAKVEGERLLGIFEIETYQPVRLDFKEGSYFPIHCGAYGKSAMAFFEPREQLEAIAHSSTFEAYTKNTITDPDALLAEYARIRERGYAISDEEHFPGLMGIGAPVFDSKGRIYGSVGTALIKGATDADAVERLIPRIVAGAREISRYII